MPPPIPGSSDSAESTTPGARLFTFVEATEYLDCSNCCMSYFRHHPRTAGTAAKRSTLEFHNCADFAFRQFLGWVEGFAAFHAIHFAARRDQPAKWANPVRRELALWRISSCQLFCQGGQEPKRSADAGKELIQRRDHDINVQSLLSQGMHWDSR